MKKNITFPQLKPYFKLNKDNSIPKNLFNEQKNGLDILMFVISFNKQLNLNIGKKQLKFLIKNTDIKKDYSTYKNGDNFIMLLIKNNISQKLFIEKSFIEKIIYESDLLYKNSYGNDLFMTVLDHSFYYNENLINFLLKNSDLKNMNNGYYSALDKYLSQISKINLNKNQLIYFIENSNLEKPIMKILKIKNIELRPFFYIDDCHLDINYEHSLIKIFFNNNVLKLNPEELMLFIYNINLNFFDRHNKTIFYYAIENQKQLNFNFKQLEYIYNNCPKINLNNVDLSVKKNIDNFLILLEKNKIENNLASCEKEQNKKIHKI